MSFAQSKDASPGQRCRNRQSEWTAAGAILGLGILIAIWPESLGASNWAPLTEVMRPQLIGLCCLLVGLLHLIALWHNGYWGPYGAAIRTICCIFGCAIVASIAMALIRQSISVWRPPSPGIPFYIAWSVAEFFSAGRAAADVWRNRL